MSMATGPGVMDLPGILNIGGRVTLLILDMRSTMKSIKLWMFLGHHLDLGIVRTISLAIPMDTFVRRTLLEQQLLQHAVQDGQNLGTVATFWALT